MNKLDKLGGRDNLQESMLRLRETCPDVWDSASSTVHPGARQKKERVVSSESIPIKPKRRYAHR